MKKEETKNKKFISIKSIMLVQILMISSLITAILTGISLAREYRIGMNELEESFELIKKTKLSSLAEATWSFNQEQSISQIKGILQQQEMVEVDLIDESGESIFKVQKVLGNIVVWMADFWMFKMTYQAVSDQILVRTWLVQKLALNVKLPPNRESCYDFVR